MEDKNDKEDVKDIPYRRMYTFGFETDVSSTVETDRVDRWLFTYNLHVRCIGSEVKRDHRIHKILVV